MSSLTSVWIAFGLRLARLSSRRLYKSITVLASRWQDRLYSTRSEFRRSSLDLDKRLKNFLDGYIYNTFMDLPFNRDGEESGFAWAKGECGRKFSLFSSLRNHIQITSFHNEGSKGDEFHWFNQWSEQLICAVVLTDTVVLISYISNFLNENSLTYFQFHRLQIS